MWLEQERRIRQKGGNKIGENEEGKQLETIPEDRFSSERKSEENLLILDQFKNLKEGIKLRKIWSIDL